MLYKISASKSPQQVGVIAEFPQPTQDHCIPAEKTRGSLLAQHINFEIQMKEAEKQAIASRREKHGLKKYVDAKTSTHARHAVTSTNSRALPSGSRQNKACRPD